MTIFRITELLALACLSAGTTWAADVPDLAGSSPVAAKTTAPSATAPSTTAPSTTAPSTANAPVKTAGKTVSAGTAADTKVGENGVVIDLRDKNVATVPSVAYQADGTAIATYEAPTMAANFDPSRFQGKSIRLSVGDVEMMAMNYSWNLKKTLTERLQARAKKLGALGAALPSPTFSTGWQAVQSNATGTTQSLSASNQWSLSTGVQQPLFLGGSVISQFKEADLYNDFVSEDIRRVRLAVIYAIRNQYYLALQNKKIAEIYYDQTEIAKEYWEKTKKRYEADDVAEIDVLRYEVDYKIQKANYIQASNNYNVAVADLMRLIGLPLDTQVDFADPFAFVDYAPGSEQALTAEALKTRPEIKQAQLNEQMQKENIWQEKSELFPKVYANGDWSNSNNYSYTNQRRSNDWNWGAGVTVSWNALAGGGQIIRSKVINAEAILDQYKFTTNDTVDQVRQEVKDSLLNLSSSIDWVKSQQENVQQASRVLKQQTIRWDEGAGAYLDILDARSKLAQTQLLYWQGIYNYKVSIVALDYSVGRFNSSAESLVKGYSVRKEDIAANRAAAERVQKKFQTVDSRKLLADEFNRLSTPATPAATKETPVRPAHISEGITAGEDQPQEQALPSAAEMSTSPAKVRETAAPEIPPAGPQPMY